MAAPVLIMPDRVAGTDRLPFTVIDQAVHILETPAEPWTIQLEVRVEGHLDERRLRHAVRAATGAHPMARARQLPARRSDRTWWWEVAPDLDLDPVRVVICPDDASLTLIRNEVYSRQVPLVEAPPFRLVLARRHGGDTLLLGANHAAFDGFGCLRLLRSVARRYADRPDPATVVSLGEARDLEHHLTAPDAATRARRLRLLASKAADVARRPTRLAPEGGRDGPGCGLQVVALDAEQSRQVASCTATINDLLVAALTSTIVGWNEEHGAPADRISLLVPVNVRPKAWREDVVTNMVLESRILTTTAQRQGPSGPAEREEQGPSRLVAVVADQSARIKQGAGPALFEVLDGWSSLPLWSKQPLNTLLLLTGNRLVDTALVTNLGNLAEPPDFGPGAGPVTEAWFSAPARMPCGLSVGALSVSDRLHLCFRYRRPLLGDDAAGRLAHRFVDELVALSATA